MIHAKILSALLLALALSVSLDACGGPKWSGFNPSVDYYIDEEGCEDVIDEWPHLERGFRVWRKRKPG